MYLIPPLSGNAFQAAYFIGFEIVVPQPVVCEFHTVQRRALQLFPVNTQINVVFSAFKTVLHIEFELVLYGNFSKIRNKRRRAGIVGKYQLSDEDE